MAARGRWPNYEPWLAPLLEALGAIEGAVKAEPV